MGDKTVTLAASQQSLDLNILRSRISELRDVHRSCDEVSKTSPSDSEELMKDCALELQSKITQLLSEVSDVDSLTVEDLDEYLEHLKGELSSVETENATISDEIEDLSRRYVEDSNRLESDLEGLNCHLDFITSQGLEKAKKDGEDEMNLSHAHEDSKFKILELSHRIERNKTTLKSLQDLDCIFKRLEAVEKSEDTLTGLKVIEFEGNHIRLSLRTYVTKPEGLLSQQKIEDTIERLEQNHELLIEVVDGTMELKNVEIFPNDVYIGEIIDAVKSFSWSASRHLFSPLPVLETRSPLEWFVRRVQDRIVLSTLRRFVVKGANKSRHSFEYLDKDEIIVAHMAGGVEGFIKLSQGWPLSDSALKLMSLKSSSHSKEISLSFLCKVEEEANSLDGHIQQNLSSFVDAIEEILVRQMRAELQSDDRTEK